MPTPGNRASPPPDPPRFAATIIDGKATSETIRQEVAEDVKELKAKYGKVGPVPAGLPSPSSPSPAGSRRPRDTPRPRAVRGDIATKGRRNPAPAPFHRPAEGAPGGASRGSRPGRAAAPASPLAPAPPPLASPQTPGLAVVLVGERKDSQTYVRSKKKACEECGVVSFGTDLPDTATEAEVLEVVSRYNADPDCHGILVQLPLPGHINEQTVLDAISLEKDVDGFHPTNVGMLAMRGREPLYVPCTPKGCIELLDRYGIEISGKKAVVVGRSNIVGLPAAMLLQERDATVTMVHSRTADPASYLREADIVVAALGRAEWVKGEWLKEGAVVIDVGINAVDDATKKRGYRLVGDVDYAAAEKVCSAITPVPGGVGPMTIAMLLRNCVDGARRAFEQAA